MAKAALIPSVPPTASSQAIDISIQDLFTRKGSVLIEALGDAERSFSNTVTLDHLMEGTSLRLRGAILGALIWDGFELYETLPDLQHPADILKAIKRVEALGFGTAWETFHQALLAAEKFGTLVDLSLRKDHSQQTGSRNYSGRPLRYQPKQ